MTLGELFGFLNQNPTYITTFFLAMPALAVIVNWICGDEGHQSPWKYLYSALIFATCVPGIMSVGLTVYYFLFERQSIMSTNILTQVLPVLSMILTVSIVRRQVSLDHIPGSERISSLVMLISAVLVLMYILDRTRLFVMISLPVYQFVLILVGLLLVVRFALRRIMA
jgi:hypothetical protein